MSCSFVPPFLLRRLADSTAAQRSGGPDRPGLRAPGSDVEAGLDLDRRLRERRLSVGPAPAPAVPGGSGTDVAWAVHDAEQGEELPGRLVQLPSSEPTDDVAVAEAAYGTQASLDLLAEVFGRDSYDGAGATAVVTVHFGRGYDNAFWDGSQLVFGDGDGEVFGRFTRPVDVLGHELAHAVTERTAGLVYADQPGALNESFSDVFAACLKQRLAGQTAAEADWLVGEGIFQPGVQARALRDMAAPGTAYDDPRLGRDPQVGHMRDYLDTEEDNGGVHLNSGIPNRAFVLAARAIGGASWEGAGQVWWRALTGTDVGPRTDFSGFAAACVAAAGPHADLVRQAWAEVGVVAAPAGSSPGAGDDVGAGASWPSEDPAASEAVVVRRTGGVAGRSVQGIVDLDGDDPVAAEVRVLLTRVDLRLSEDLDPAPDRFTYVFEARGRTVRVPEHALTDDLRRLASLVLPD